MAGTNAWKQFRNVLFYVFNLAIGKVGRTFNGTVSTTDATQTTCVTYTPTDGQAVLVRVEVAGRKSDGTQAAGFIRQAAFRRAGAATTQVGATIVIGTDLEDDAAWDVTLDASGTDVRVRVTGKAATTIAWSAVGYVTTAPGL